MEGKNSTGFKYKIVRFLGLKILDIYVIRKFLSSFFLAIALILSIVIIFDLSEKIDDGFAFPLNPKWVLCDEGWKDLYDKLLASEKPNVQDAMNVWYPADVRERIDAISSNHPNGFK